ncbi:hypothetical protein NA57DRAFT_77566 [Rhizodiscina lignyota]|uniref:DUF6594 domain-containing protein n=1 Tax=Rhizodiscina lignyota TaxID=1504668 RepID=A0A9P4M8Z9_9PEZI|nr:hypothetical protein NA57DRAFT_77566 [Rhizodiscina lignyota]
MSGCEPSYVGLAKFFGLADGLAIFRRFKELNTRNLLYLQAELIHLEQKLYTHSSQDSTSSDPNCRQYSTYALRLIMSPNSPGSTDGAQWQTILDIREKLKEYNVALLHQAELHSLPRPTPYDLELVQRWLKHPEGGKDFLKGFESDTWQNENATDLVTVSSGRNWDPFLKWVAERLVPFLYHRGCFRWKKPLVGHEELGIVQWKDSRYSMAARMLGAAAATILLIVSVLTLYFIRKLINRLFAVMGFSVAFSMALTFFTTAKPIEIFAAGAAFASVQVVFIGNTQA